MDDAKSLQESAFYSNAIFFIEVDKIKPNPFQTRSEFDQAKLQDLADSIKMYGILQPLVVTRKEVIKEDGGLATEYELIAGERRLRASKLAGLREVPAIIRAKEDDDKAKLELAIIENLQREDISPVDKARAFKQLAEKFNMTHGEIAKKVGKSREYVSNSIRILGLPEEMLTAMAQGKITEGHSRPLLMLVDRPEEQHVLFRDIMLRKLTVRDAEKISRKIATERVRKTNLLPDAELMEIEHEIGTILGTRVNIAKKEEGGRIQIDFFNEEDLHNIVALLLKRGGSIPTMSTTPVIASPVLESTSTPEIKPTSIVEAPIQIESNLNEEIQTPQELVQESLAEVAEQKDVPVVEQIEEEKFADQQVVVDTPNYGDEEDLYSMKGFSL
ncbi:MAG: chromosome partitioning protein ParB, chromosome partitioning protein ParB family [Candidatus Parcubacteria bacterium]